MTTPREPDPVAEALPCTCGYSWSGYLRDAGDGHYTACPAFYRPAVTALLAAKDAEIARLREAIKEVDRWCLVILSAVNYADRAHIDAVSDALKGARAALEQKP